MNGLRSLKSIKSVVVKHNDVNLKTSKELIVLLERPFPDNLEELRIVSCKINQFVSSQIVSSLADNCMLRKISLTQAELRDVDMPQICKMLNEARFLIDLDLSWNELTTHAMLKLAENLAENRQLQYLNLSWNFLTSKAPHKFELFQEDWEAKANEVRTKLEKMRMLPKRTVITSDQDKIFQKMCQEYIMNKEPKLSPEQYDEYLLGETAKLAMHIHNLQMCDYLTRFIKHNTNLLHVTLENTRLTETMLFKICSSLRRAPSLISLHVSGNPGINYELRKQVARKIRCKKAAVPRKVTLDGGTEEEFQKVEMG